MTIFLVDLTLLLWLVEIVNSTQLSVMTYCRVFCLLKWLLIQTVKQKPW